MSKERIIVDHRGTEREVKPEQYIPDTPEKNIIVTPGKRKIRIGWRRIFHQLEGISRVIDNAEICQEEGSYRVKIDRPDIPWVLGIAFSDAHIGSYTTDHKLVRDIIDLTLATPNTFLIDDGDTFDAGIWGGLAHENVIPTYLQTFTVKDMARELGDKFAACVIGNHPEWLFSSAGIKPEFLFAEEIRGPIFAGMGLLHLQAGRQRYDIALSHNYWGKSKKNIFNVCVNLRNHEYPNADVFIVGHEHIWGHMTEKIDDKPRLYIRPGTAKTKDRYARTHGIAKRGQKMGIGILFHTKEHYFEAKPIDKAVEFIDSM